MRTEPTAERLRQLLYYCPRTGRFHWRVKRGNAAAGFEAGSGSKDGYRTIQIDGRPYYAHRLAWLYVHGEHPAGQIDHKNNKRGQSHQKPARRSRTEKRMA
jgi:hypothetical protein